MSVGKWASRKIVSEYLDEGSTSPLHAVNQEGIPPEGSGSLVVPLGLPLTKPDDGYCYNDGDKDEDQV
jgi:hypothetical protein